MSQVNKTPMLHAILLGAATAAALLAPVRPAQAVPAQVAEASGFSLVYSLALPNTAAYDFNRIPYAVDNHAAVAPGSFSRVAYYLELQKASGPLQYVFVSMDAFTTNAGLIGIPNAASGAFFQKNVSNMNVYSNVAGVVTGSGITTGSLEFWNWDYATANTAAVPGANGAVYDFGDQPLFINHYGSFQVNNYGARQTVLAYNSWGGDVPIQFGDLGIGNQPTGHSDWTFAANASSFTVKNLEIYVASSTPLQAQAVAEPASLAILGTAMVAASLGRRRRTDDDAC